MADVSNFIDSLKRLGTDGQQAIAAATSLDALEAARIEFLGDARGRLKAAQKELGGVAREDKPQAGREFNAVKGTLERLHAERRAALEAAARPAGAQRDLTLPARRRWTGAKHPVTLVIEEICAIFRELGFTVAQGPEAETEWYNFLSLNFPPDHPAMDAHDTLYLDGGGLLRTHTSPVQVRAMLRDKPPLRMIMPGRVYRCDSDMTHTPMFHQVEGLVIDDGVSFANLKSVLHEFMQQYFERDLGIRFRPSYFPFTEPSAEVDIECVFCSGAGCRVCKQTGWLDTEMVGINRDRIRYRIQKFGLEEHYAESD